MRLHDSRELDGRVFKGIQKTTNACGMNGLAESGPTNEWVALFELTWVTGDWYSCGWQYCCNDPRGIRCRCCCRGLFGWRLQKILGRVSQWRRLLLSGAVAVELGA